MRPLIFSLLLLGVLLSSCGKLPEARPSDFSLVLEWDTGALPPEYHYAYTIAIGPGAQGEFTYQPGYEEKDENFWLMPFEISEARLQSLYTWLRDNDLMRRKWNAGQPLLGGQGTAILINAFGAQYLVPSISEINQSDRELVEKAIEEIRACVPAEIWREMEKRQAVYELTHGG